MCAGGQQGLRNSLGSTSQAVSHWSADASLAPRAALHLPLGLSAGRHGTQVAKRESMSLVSQTFSLRPPTWYLAGR